MLDLNTCASVDPDVVRISAVSQSKVHAAPEQSESLVWGQYQNVSCELPVGMVRVCERLLSPAGSGAGWTTPRSAEWVPVWACAVLTDGLDTPPAVQGVRPLSKPPLMSGEALAEGVTAFDGAEAAELPLGLAALTVNV